MSATYNLLLGAFLRLTHTRPRGDVWQDLERALDLFPRLQERRHQLAGALSGGEQQMLAMARAVMLNPDVILLDEPSMGLAPILVEEVVRIVARLRRDGVTMWRRGADDVGSISPAHNRLSDDRRARARYSGCTRYAPPTTTRFLHSESRTSRRSIMRKQIATATVLAALSTFAFAQTTAGGQAGATGSSSVGSAGMTGSATGTGTGSLTPSASTAGRTNNSTSALPTGSSMQQSTGMGTNSMGTSSMGASSNGAMSSGTNSINGTSTSTGVIGTSRAGSQRTGTRGGTATRVDGGTDGVINGAVNSGSSTSPRSLDNGTGTVGGVSQQR